MPLDAEHGAEAIAWGVAGNEAAVLVGLGNPAAYGVVAGGAYLYSAWRKAPCQ